jgi:antirestriction protein ArdC
MRDLKRAHDPKALNVGEMTMATTSRIDVYTRVTEAIVTDLEQEVRSWTKPYLAAYGI